MPTPCAPASGPGGPYCLTFTGSQYSAVHLGQKFEVSIVDAATCTSPTAPYNCLSSVIATQSTSVPANGFFLNFPQTLVAGHQYYVDYYADENHSGLCDPPPHTNSDGTVSNPGGDHVWRSHIYVDFFLGTVTKVPSDTQTVSGDVLWATVHDDPFLDVTTGLAMNTCTQLP